MWNLNVLICNMIEIEKEQLVEEIKTASDEMAKMQKDIFSSPLVFFSHK